VLVPVCRPLPAAFTAACRWCWLARPISPAVRWPQPAAGRPYLFCLVIYYILQQANGADTSTYTDPLADMMGY